MIFAVDPASPDGDKSMGVEAVRTPDGTVKILSVGEVIEGTASRPQEQPRKATGDQINAACEAFYGSTTWDRIGERGAEPEQYLMARALNAALALSVSPAAAEGWQVITEITAERQRQRTVEGWTNEHDDGHRNGSLASAAAAYALRGADRPLAASDAWPASWDRKWFKPKDRRRDLIRAGALIVAEIERRDRAAPPSPAAQEQK